MNVELKAGNAQYLMDSAELIVLRRFGDFPKQAACRKAGLGLKPAQHRTHF
jgi:hypothetical protein